LNKLIFLGSVAIGRRSAGFVRLATAHQILA
jgi:hypothetical protein